MGDRLAVIWAKLGQADPQGGGGGVGGMGRPDVLSPSPSPPPRAGPSGDSNQTHNTVSFLART